MLHSRQLIIGTFLSSNFIKYSGVLFKVKIITCKLEDQSGPTSDTAEYNNGGSDGEVYLNDKTVT